MSSFFIDDVILFLRGRDDNVNHVIVRFRVCLRVPACACLRVPACVRKKMMTLRNHTHAKKDDVIINY